MEMKQRKTLIGAFGFIICCLVFMDVGVLRAATAYEGSGAEEETFGVVMAFDTNPTFRITEDDARFLRYLSYENKFDYSGIEYEIGEFILSDGNGDKQRIQFVDWPSDKIVIYGDSTQGIDPALLPAAGRTRSFNIGGEGPNKIQFYRRVSGWAPSNAFPDMPPDNEDPDYTPTPWDVLDHSEWVVRVLRADNNEHLFTLDSVGVPAHNDPNLTGALKYGTNPKKVRQEFVLPNELSGEEVYLQIYSKRWGPTDYGMRLLSESTWINVSALQSEYGVRLANVSDTLHQQYFDEILVHCDSIKQQTGWLPETRYFELTLEEFADINRRYLIPRIESGDTIWTEIDTNPSVVVVRVPQADGGFKTEYHTEKTVRILNISPQPLNKLDFALDLSLLVSLEVRISLHTIAGRKVAGLWTGKLTRGPHSLQLQLPDTELAPGGYMLMVNANRGNVGAGRAIVIQP